MGAKTKDRCFIEVRARKGGGWVVGVRYGGPSKPGVYNWQSKMCPTTADVRMALRFAEARRKQVNLASTSRRRLHPCLPAARRRWSARLEEIVKAPRVVDVTLHMSKE